MAERRAKIWILLCGIVIFTATPLCHAQDTGTQSEVIKPKETVSPVLLPKFVDISPPLPAEEKPVNKVIETAWYWKFLGWLAMDFAKFNTEKQSDGRPQQFGNFR